MPIETRLNRIRCDDDDLDFTRPAAMGERAVMPRLDHLDAADFLHVYEPQEDTWLLCDALLAERALLRASAPAVALEIG